MKESLKRVAVVREEFFALTKDFFTALVLNQFNVYQSWAKHVSKYIEQENARSQAPEDSAGYIKPTEGWFYKSAEELCEELMHPFKKSKAMELIQVLIDRGWVLVRQNPVNKWDRVKQYRVDLVKLSGDLEDLGYSLPLWDTSALKLARNSISTTRNTFPPHGNVNSTTRKAIPKEPIGNKQRKENPALLRKESFSFSDSGTVPTITEDVVGHPTTWSPDPGLNIPRYRQPGFPVLPNGCADHVQAVELFDPEGGRLFSRLYKDFVWTQPTARLFLRKRRSGELTSHMLRLMHDCCEEGWQEWEPQEYRRPATAHKLLGSHELTAAVERAKRCAWGEIEAEQSMLKGMAYTDDECFTNQLNNTYQRALVFIVNNPGNRDCARLRQELSDTFPTWAILFWAARGGFPLPLTGVPEFRESCQEALRVELGRNPRLYDFIRAQGADPETVFGIPEAEVEALIAEQRRPHEKRIARIQRLLVN